MLLLEFFRLPGFPKRLTRVVLFGVAAYGCRSATAANELFHVAKLFRNFSRLHCLDFDAENGKVLQGDAEVAGRAPAIVAVYGRDLAAFQGHDVASHDIDLSGRDSRLDSSLRDVLFVGQRPALFQPNAVGADGPRAAK